MNQSPLFIALGTNLGDRVANLAEARRRISQHFPLIRASHLYETPPWGITDQPAFYNQVIETCTDTDPLDLLQLVKRMEVEMGRVPGLRYGPRLIDIDLLVYGERVLETADLSLPHPRLFERAFVLVPLAEIAPDMIPPTQTTTIRELCNRLDTSGIIRLEEIYA
ncbi:MAG: 2-amino-4-hydroxy-6-hydroxymethyldihydropteridine diphosphokinase [Anaerolineaceae bacterium]|nr:2-amino-4-hydroxy-6-hydroxymethyldihydropteridine diphosphokinase [Anaerolineaceae bacterium]